MKSEIKYINKCVVEAEIISCVCMASLIIKLGG